MKKEFFQKIEIPDGVEINIEEKTLTAKGPEGKNKKTFDTGKLIFEKKDNHIIIGHTKATKKEKKMINTIASHIRNMIKGVQKKAEYKLRAVFSHFPINVEVRGKEVIIKNFLGEKTPRKMQIKEGVEIKIEKDVIIVSSTNKELAGQTAADLEKITRIRMRDRRIFQDGIFITEKNGKEI